MWRAERALVDERSARAQLAGNAVYLGGFKAFGERKGRKYRGKSLGHHRFAAARRSHHDEVMPAGCCNFECTLHVFLPSDIAEVEVEQCLLLVKLLSRVDNHGCKGLRSREKLDDIDDAFHAIDLEIVHHGRLSDVVFRHNQPLETLGPRLDGNGKGTFDGLQPTVKPQLSDHHIAVETVCLYASSGRKQGNCQRKVKATALLFQVSRRHVHGDIGLRKLVTAVQKGCGNAVTSLLYGFIPQSREVVNHAGIHAYLNGNGGHFESVYSGTIGFYEHGIRGLRLFFRSGSGLFSVHLLQSVYQVVGRKAAGHDAAVL